MPIRYKLTDANMQTHNGTQWVLGEWKEASGDGPLCSGAWLHCYTDPLLAGFLDCRHDNFGPTARLFRCEVDGACKTDRGLKEGWSRMRLVEEIPLRWPSTEQRVRFAILCALDAYQDPEWRKWAAGWLSGRDRSRSAYAAAYAACAACAACAAYAAAYAACAACAAYAAYAADAADADLVSAAHEAWL